MVEKHGPNESESSQCPSFSSLLLYYRKRAGLTQLQVQMKLMYMECVYSDSTISMWETGERLPDDSRLFHYLGKVLSLRSEEEAALINAYVVEWIIRKLEAYFELKSSEGEVIPPEVIRIAVQQEQH